MAVLRKCGKLCESVRNTRLQQPKCKIRVNSAMCQHPWIFSFFSLRTGHKKRLIKQIVFLVCCTSPHFIYIFKVLFKIIVKEMSCIPTFWNSISRHILYTVLLSHYYLGSQKPSTLIRGLGHIVQSSAALTQTTLDQK